MTTKAKGPTYDDNKARLEPLLSRLGAGGIGHTIAGKRVDTSATFETHSPVDKTVITKVARGSADTIDHAAAAAKQAFKAWAAWAPEKRRAVLHKIADTIVEHAEEIAVLESWDTGQPYRFMSKAAIRGAENFRFFADRVPEARDGRNMPTPDHWNVSTRVPIGPVGIITPWNTPFMLSTWKIAPALAAGCTVVHKPAEWSPVTADLLVRLCQKAGLAGWRAQHRTRLWRGCWQGADRASGHQGDRLCRRKLDRLCHHAPGRRHSEARALRTRRQEPGHRLC